MSTQDILIRFQDYFSIKEIFNVPFTYLGELLLRLIYSIATVAENLVTQVYRVSDFYSTGQVEEFYTVILAVSWGFLAIIVAWIGIKKISGIPVPNQTIFRNLVLALLFVIILPDMMVKFDDLATIGKDGASEIAANESESDSLAMLAISDNVTDLLILDNNNFEGTASDTYGVNNITVDNFKYTNFQEAIEANQEGINNNEVFENRITVTENGDTEVEELESGWLSWNQTYYRYSIDYVTVIIQLLILSVVYIFFAFKIIQISFELAVTKIISPILIFTDIGTGQKVKQIFKEVVNGFATLAIIFFLLRLYQIFVTWISTPNVIVPGEMNPLLKALILVILGLVVIDGTSVITRLLGFDVGVKDGFKTMAGMYAGSKGISAISKSVGSSVGNGVSAISSKMKPDSKPNEENGISGVGTTDKGAEATTNSTGDTSNAVGIGGVAGSSTGASAGSAIGANSGGKNGLGVAETGGESSAMDSERSVDQNPVTGQQGDIESSGSNSPIKPDTGTSGNVQLDESTSSMEGLESPQSGDLEGGNGDGSQTPLAGQQINADSSESGTMTEQQNQVSGTATKQQGVNQTTTENISTDNKGQMNQGSSNVNTEKGSSISGSSTSIPVNTASLENSADSNESTSQDQSSSLQSNGNRENTVTGSNTETQNINESTNGNIRNDVRINTGNGVTSVSSIDSFSESGSSSREMPKPASSDYSSGSNAGETTTFNTNETSTSHSTNNVVGTNNKEQFENVDTNYSVSNQTTNKLNETMKEFSSNINSQHSKPKTSKRPTL
ncbi:pLS20_p028 family conjugation system transmembrane protein [Alkalibacterium sp. 20]|uniref:pLS20_p028 family conjugation system transmembrane protein n=1 Tax=Alkalibacterium sp. 20 TaxID=1798803 RepID=UPI0009000DC2|nr:hypothetical protein [Alkalibacterium sp. 20]OJF96184.1 hypothetical protein AX762_05475 [Alkalibacterium sp. 20]